MKRKLLWNVVIFLGLAFALAELSVCEARVVSAEISLRKLKIVGGKSGARRVRIHGNSISMSDIRNSKSYNSRFSCVGIVFRVNSLTAVKAIFMQQRRDREGNVRWEMRKQVSERFDVQYSGALNWVRGPQEPGEYKVKVFSDGSEIEELFFKVTD